jgi:hypothetical protein
LATVKEPVNTPPVTEHVEVEIDPESDNAQVVSPGENPEPDTETEAPTWADVGLSAIATGSVVTWKFATALSPPGLPVAVIGYKPAGTLATRYVAVRLPPEIEQLEDAIDPLSEREHVVSEVKNPVPVT